MASSARGSTQATSSVHKVSARARGLISLVGPGFIGVAIIIALFESFSRLGVWNPDRIPPVSEMLAELAARVGTATFWSAIGHTITGWSIGLGLAVLIGVPLGLAIGSIPLLDRALRATIEVLRSVPPVVLLPLAVLLYGPTRQMQVFLITLGAVFPILYQSAYGARAVEPTMLDTARVFGMGRLERTVRVVLPLALPYVATGIRMASSMGIIVAIVAELLGGAAGLGNEMITARVGGDFTTMYALIIAAGLLGLAINLVMERIEASVLHWHELHRPELK